MPTDQESGFNHLRLSFGLSMDGDRWRSITPAHSARRALHILSNDFRCMEASVVSEVQRHRVLQMSFRWGSI